MIRGSVHACNVPSKIASLLLTLTDALSRLCPDMKSGAMTDNTISSFVPFHSGPCFTPAFSHVASMALGDESTL